jgi:hypothetical protein
MSWAAFLVCVANLCWSSLAISAELKFEFSAPQPTPGFTQVPPETAYDAQRGFGFLDAGTAATQTLRFAVDVEEGNYDVAMRFGNALIGTSTTIKSESRRLMLEKVETEPGKFDTRRFTVNVRKPAISTGGVTALNDRENGPPVVRIWDENHTF